MNGQELKHELTERWQAWPDSLPYLDVYINTDTGQRPLVALDYDKENHRIVMIPEGKEPTPPPIEEYSEASVSKEDEPWLSKDSNLPEEWIDAITQVIVNDIRRSGPMRQVIEAMR